MTDFDEDKARREREQGSRAQAILQDPMVWSVLKAIRDEAVKELIDTDATDAFKLLRAKAKVEGAAEFVSAFESMINTGRMAEQSMAEQEAALEDEKKAAEFMKDIGLASFAEGMPLVTEK